VQPSTPSTQPTAHPRLRDHPDSAPTPTHSYTTRMMPCKAHQDKACFGCCCHCQCLPQSAQSVAAAALVGPALRMMALPAAAADCCLSRLQAQHTPHSCCRRILQCDGGGAGDGPGGGAGCSSCCSKYCCRTCLLLLGCPRPPQQRLPGPAQLLLRRRQLPVVKLGFLATASVPLGRDMGTEQSIRTACNTVQPGDSW